ncbi:UNVERIFIED_CONTAM: Leucine-rich repeat serine/threonine-protein kinase 2 [Gekko kuhli]
MSRQKGNESRCSCDRQEAAEEERQDAALKKLIVRLKNVQEGKQVETLIQILEDLLAFASSPSGPKLLREKNLQVPLLLVLVSYMRVADVQQVKQELVSISLSFGKD